jgi:hypothetical protein
MAFAANGPDATEKPATIHTIPARTVARNLLHALMTRFPGTDFRIGVVVNYNTAAIASGHAVPADT